MVRSGAAVHCSAVSGETSLSLRRTEQCSGQTMYHRAKNSVIKINNIVVQCFSLKTSEFFTKEGAILELEANSVITVLIWFRYLC